ncbi:GNAT family N-acetyltransferase [Streptomyces sp. NPDC127166]|uniref:GNAT family N-acetyltransferase n=1 Tax=Streptomyces sp. NPDC127166 TaxID=3345380 RepID=UPI0036423219
MLVAETAEPVRFAAVAAHTRPTGTYTAWAKDKMQWHGPVRLLRVVAVHVDFQGCGLGHESMENALDDITDREDGEEVLVISLVHESNKRSQAMITSQYFELAPFPLDGNPEMQVWFGNF